MSSVKMEASFFNVFKQVTCIVIIICTSTLIIGAYSEEFSPTIDDLLNITCTYERPNLCLPYGVCCRISEYCHTGQCEPCLPRSVLLQHREQQLSWCRNLGQYSIALMASNTCRLTCYDLFTPEEMTSFPENNSLPNVTDSMVSRLDGSSSYYSHTSTAAIVLSSLAVGLMLTIIIFMLIYIWRRKHKRPAIVEDGGFINLENKKEGKNLASRAQQKNTGAGKDVTTPESEDLLDKTTTLNR